MHKKEIKKHGAFPMAQSEKNCAVFGMPKSAIEAGGIGRVVDLGEMATAIYERDLDDGVYWTIIT